MQKVCRLIWYALVAACCVAHTVSESKAGEEGAPIERWQRVGGETAVYRGNAQTKVRVIGNTVLVPVTLVYQGNQVDVQLILDTGAGATTIHAEIANRLNVDLSKAKKRQARVAGGAVIEGHQVTLSRITVGPHTKENIAVFVVPHKGPPAAYDGLLGMDILRGLKYVPDLEKQIITWE